MGKTATAFKDIGKACSDLLTKDYKVGKNTVEVKTKTSNGVTFTPIATKSDSGVTGSLAAKYAFPAVTAEATLNTSGVVSSTIETAALAKGLVVTLDCESAAKGKNALLASGKATAEYKQELFACKASYDYYKGAASAAVSSVFSGLVFGGSADYSVTKSSLSSYAAAGQYAQSDFTVAAKLSENLAKPEGQVYECTYIHKISPAMQVGTELKKASKKEDVDLAFGCIYKMDKDTTVKGKVDANGIVSCSYKQVISPITTMTLAATVDTGKLTESSKHKVGFQLNVTP
jgi:voltage-dependent anion channel protein 2